MTLRFVRTLVPLAAAVLLATTSLHAQTSTTTALSANPTTVSPGASVQLTATVSVPANDPAPTGTIQFVLNGAAFATQTLSNGTASVTGSSSGIQPGTYSVTAQYLGDSNYAASKSSPTAVTVSQYATQTNLTVPSVIQTGASATLNASVATSSKDPLTGTVSFYLGTYKFGTAKVTNGQASISGSAAGLSTGTYQVTAAYSGDSYNAASTSAAQNVTVASPTTLSFSVSPGGVIQVGSNAILSASVGGGSGVPATGTVSVYSGTMLLVKFPISNSSGSLQVSTTGFQPGTYALTAKYSGDSNYLAATANTSVNLEGTTTAFALTPNGAAITPGKTTQFSVTPATSSTVTWYVNGVAGGSAATGTISSTGVYTAPSAASPLSVSITANEASNPYGYSAAAAVYVVVPGKVATTNNKQVAAYTISAPAGGEFSVEFGPDTTYGRNTWQQPTPSGGGSIKMLVAGMMTNTTYHMRADVAFPNGIVFQDADHTFASGQNLGNGGYPLATVQTAAGYTPQPGIEFMSQPAFDVLAYDLQGNMIYGFSLPTDTTSSDGFWPAKLLPNGNIIYQLGPNSSYPVDDPDPLPTGTTISIRQVKLDGTLVSELTLAEVQAALNASGYVDGQGNQITLLNMHHDFMVNPVNGHLVLITNTTRVYNNLTGFNNAVTVLGDVLIDLDPNNNNAVDWVWNEFDHLDINRHPMSFPDWTHTNAVVYSPSDHQLLVSIRHQNWLLKLDYNDGAGSGDILWHFGYQGDFALVNGTSPTDWQYAQHGPTFTTANTSGVFGLTVMDNGDDRIFPAGVTCTNVAGGSPQCYYSRTPVFTVDENAMTATLTDSLPGPGYSYWGGNAAQLANGDYESDYCGIVNGSIITEYTGDSSQTLVWQMTTPGGAEYRANRIGSLYPGVTWTK